MKKGFYIIMLNILLLSCGREYHCPGYDINDKNGIAFRLGDSVMYLSNLNDTLIFDVDDFYAEEPSSYKLGFLMEGHCTPECYYKMTSRNNLKMTIKETQTWSLEICFGEDRPYEQVVFHFPPKHVNSYSEYEVSVNKDYITTVNDLSGKRNIDSFIKAPFRGITEFHDKQTGLTWTQIEK